VANIPCLIWAMAHPDCGSNSRSNFAILHATPNILRLHEAATPRESMKGVGGDMRTSGRRDGTLRLLEMIRILELENRMSFMVL
jgi:hypothetical protein